MASSRFGGSLPRRTGVRSGRGHLWPTQQQEWLLRACLLQREEAARAYREWSSQVGIEALDYGSLRMLPLLYRNLQRIGAQTPDVDKFKGAYRQTHYQNQLAFHRIAGLLRRFCDAGIDVLVLKGAALIPLYYRESGVRPMADFDVLVQREQALDAIDLLLRCGWQRDPGLPLTAGFVSVHYSWQFHLPAAAELDLHWYVFDQCCYPGADATLWDASVPLEINGQRVRTLCPADQLLHTCVHGAEWNSIPPLRWVADAVTILNEAAGQIDWNRLVDQARQRRLVAATRDTLAYLRDNLEAPVPSAVLEQLHRVSITLGDRLEYRSRTHAPGNFPSLRKIAFGYRRHCLYKTGPVFWSPLGLLRYLRDRWGAETIAQLPSTGLRLVWASVRERFLPRKDHNRRGRADRAQCPSAISVEDVPAGKSTIAGC